MRISMPLMSSLTVEIAFLMLCSGVLSLKFLPVSEIFFSMPLSLSVISVSSDSRFSTFLLTVVKLV